MTAGIRGERGLYSLSFLGIVKSAYEAGLGKSELSERFKREQIPSFSSASQLGSWFEAIKKSGAFDEAQLGVLRTLVGEKYPQYMRELGELSGATSDVSGGFRTLLDSLNPKMFPLPSGGSTGGTSGSPGAGSTPGRIFKPLPSPWRGASYSADVHAGRHIDASRLQAVMSARNPQINLTIHVDARGASNPAEVEAVAKAAVRQAVAESGREIGEIAERHLNEKYRDRQLVS